MSYSQDGDSGSESDPYNEDRNEIDDQESDPNPNPSLDDLLRIAKNNGRHELLHALSSTPVSRLKPILDEADRRS